MNDKMFIKTKVRKSLRKLFGKSNLSSYELLRLNNLSSMVSSILITGKSELRQIAYGNFERKKYSSKIKQYKRMLLNKHIDVKTYFLPYIKPLLKVLGASGQLVFSIDGSVVGKGCMCLMFSVIYKQRVLPVVWKVYKAKKGHLSEKAHRGLLKELSELVPDNCRIVITGDGEFDGCDWQADILGHGWDYVVKTGKNAQIQEGNWDNFKPKSVCLEQGDDLFFESIGFTKKGFKTNLLIWHGKGHKSPLYLVTNLDFAPEIKQFYKKRFKIEPFFRDQKSKGFHIQRSGLRTPERLEKLLIASCLAYILSVMGGLKALKSKFYDEVARTDGDFLSIFQLGYRFLLHLVDLRQWRAFSWEKDFIPDPPELYNYVPF